jgi:2-polyprenyl-6-methoxyphenol hydroxylase-like FAD-dependent oxidoreductase
VDVLVSGASVAGPVLAYWLTRYGFRVTVVERAPAPRKAGGHAVDLFAPAMDIVERMGVVEAVKERRTGTERIVVRREGAARPVTIELTRLMGVLSRRHVEIMRDDLAEVFHAATRNDVEYVFDESVTAVSAADGAVRFERGAPRRFDLVIGADGLHSVVRRLVFGPDTASARWLGAYLAVATVPDHVGLRGTMVGVTGVDRLVGVYGTREPGEARAVFLFRPPAELSYHHRDVARQKALLGEAFADMGDDVAATLEETLRAEVFYFDAITQLQMDTWSRGRVTLVGDAGYCPGPAVGGSTSLAVVGAFTLAGELALAGGDHTVAFPAYERAMADYIRRSRAFAVSVAGRLLPRTRVQAWAMTSGVRLLCTLPQPLLRAVVRSSAGRLGMHDSVVPQDYPALFGAGRAEGAPPAGT